MVLARQSEQEALAPCAPLSPSPPPPHHHHPVFCSLGGLHLRFSLFAPERDEKTATRENNKTLPREVTVALCALWVRGSGGAACAPGGAGGGGGRSGEAGRRRQGQRGRAGRRRDTLAPQSQTPGPGPGLPLLAMSNRSGGGVSLAGRPGVGERPFLARFCS